MNFIAASPMSTESIRAVIVNVFSSFIKAIDYEVSATVPRMPPSNLMRIIIFSE